MLFFGFIFLVRLFLILNMVHIRYCVNDYINSIWFKHVGFYLIIIMQDLIKLH